jgi:hypothetical protein
VNKFNGILFESDICEEGNYSIEFQGVSSSFSLLEINFHPLEIILLEILLKL